MPAMESSTGAELKTLLSGVELPADTATLLEYAVQQRVEPALLEALQELPERRYESLDEVVEALLHVQPAPFREQAVPHEESGDPPGGDDYTNASPESGQVRDLDSVED